MTAEDRAPDWWPDEIAHAGREHLDASAVAGFDRKQGDVPDLHAVHDRDVLRRHGIGSTATVVDLGAGTGRFAVTMAPHVSRVIAVDVSTAMLDALRRRVLAAGLDNICAEQVGWLRYRHRDAPVDAVHSRNTLHQLPDLFKVVALQRVADMLRPGGVLRLRDLVLSCEPAGLEPLVARWFDQAADDPREGYTRADLVEHLRTEYSTFTWLLEPILDHTGFEIVDADRHGAFAAYTCIRR